MKEKEIEEPFEFLLKEVIDGKIESWYEFEIKASLLGLTIDSDLLLDVLGFSNRLNVYNLLKNGLMDTSAIDMLFEDLKIVDYMIVSDGMTIDVGYDSDNRFQIVRFEGLKMLKQLDERNPRYMLKYFLHGKHEMRGGRYDDNFFSLFYDIIERTKMRAKKLKVFEKYIERLETIFRDYKNISTYCS